MLQAGVIVGLLGSSFAVFGLFVGLETGFGGSRTMHLPSGIAGSVLLLAGVLLYCFGTIIATLESRKPSDTSGINSKTWQALVEFDPDISAAALKAKGWGPAYMTKLATAYLALNDKIYISSILDKLEMEYNEYILSKGSISNYIDRVFIVNNEMRCGVLSDGRAIGWDTAHFRLFSSVSRYREFRKDFSDDYDPLTDEATKAAFAAQISHLRNEIVP